MAVVARGGVAGTTAPVLVGVGATAGVSLATSVLGMIARTVAVGCWRLATSLSIPSETVINRITTAMAAKADQRTALPALRGLGLGAGVALGMARARIISATDWKRAAGSLTIALFTACTTWRGTLGLILCTDGGVS